MKTRFLLLTIICAFGSFISFGQEQKYLAPQDFVSGNTRLNVSDLIGDEGVYKFRLTITNNSGTDYCVYDINKTGFEMAGIGMVYPSARKNKVIVEPNEKKSTVIHVKGAIPTVQQFKLHLDGLFSGTPNVLVNAMAPMVVSEDNVADVQGDEAGVKISKVKHLKKDLYRFNVQSEISFNEHSSNGVNLMIFDRDRVEVKDGEKLLPMTFLPFRAGAIEEGDSKKFRFDTETAGSFSLSINWNKALKKVVMANVPVNDYTITNGKVTPAPSNSNSPEVHSNQNVNEIKCDSYKGPKEGAIKVRVFNDQTTCFKLKVDGFDAVPVYTQNAEIWLDAGQHVFRFETKNGAVVEKKSIITSDYSRVGYRLKEKRNGELSAVYHAMSQVLNAQGEARRDEQMDRVNNNMNGTSSTAGNNSLRNGCLGGDFSTGSTTVKLKITYKGSAVSGNDIQIKHGNVTIGANHSDGNGDVMIKTNSLNSKNIDVYGCRDNYKWSVKGSWVTLNNSNYFHLELSDVISSVADMSGMSADSIARSWGLEK
jgi:hypothetical protein